MHFDARAAKLLKQGEHIIVAASPGLRLVVTATRCTWTYRYKSPADGRMRQVALGQWPAVLIAAATVTWKAARSQWDTGKDLAISKRAARRVRNTPAARSYTSRALCDDYLAGALEGAASQKTMLSWIGCSSVTCHLSKHWRQRV